MSTAAHLISLEEFISRPDRENDSREELIEGELIVSPGAKVWHAEIVDRLRDQLSPLRQRGYVLRNDFSCILGTLSMPVPDLAVVKKDHWHKAVKNDGWLEGSPDLVIEVASPGNRKLLQKAGVYLEHGAKQVWIVYRKTRTVTVILREGATDAGIGETIMFDGVHLPVAAIFP